MLVDRNMGIRLSPTKSTALSKADMGDWTYPLHAPPSRRHASPFHLATTMQHNIFASSHRATESTRRMRSAPSLFPPSRPDLAAYNFGPRTQPGSALCGQDDSEQSSSTVVNTPSSSDDPTSTSPVSRPESLSVQYQAQAPASSYSAHRAERESSYCSDCAECQRTRTLREELTPPSPPALPGINTLFGQQIQDRDLRSETQRSHVQQQTPPLHHPFPQRTLDLRFTAIAESDSPTPPIPTESQDLTESQNVLAARQAHADYLSYLQNARAHVTSCIWQMRQLLCAEYDYGDGGAYGAG